MNGITNPAIHAAFGAIGSAAPKLGNSATAPDQSFGEMLTNSLKEVNGAQMNATQMQNDFISGAKPVEIHDLMISMQKAGTSMQLTMAVRNKALEAYSEIEKMQV